MKEVFLRIVKALLNVKKSMELVSNLNFSLEFICALVKKQRAMGFDVF